VRNDAMNFPSVITRDLITPDEKDASGVYAARLVYAQDQPAEWSFRTPSGTGAASGPAAGDAGPRRGADL
jgi:hypothetical protein